MVVEIAPGRELWGEQRFHPERHGAREAAGKALNMAGGIGGGAKQRFEPQSQRPCGMVFTQGRTGRLRVCSIGRVKARTREESLVAAVTRIFTRWKGAERDRPAGGVVRVELSLRPHG